MARRINNQFEDDVEEVEDDDDAQEDASGEEEPQEDEEETEGQGQESDAAVRKANAEAKRHRLKAKEARRSGAIARESIVALAKAGVPPEKLDRAAEVLGTNGLDVDKNGRVTGLDDAIESLRTDVPELFASGQATDDDLDLSSLTLPSTGARHNNRKRGISQESTVSEEKRLQHKYPSLQNYIGRKR